MPLYKFEVTLGDNANVVEVECGSVKDMQAKALRMTTDAISGLRDNFVSGLAGLLGSQTRVT